MSKEAIQELIKVEEKRKKKGFDLIHQDTDYLVKELNKFLLLLNNQRNQGPSEISECTSLVLIDDLTNRIDDKRNRIVVSLNNILISSRIIGTLLTLEKKE